ncbi:6726_t:CDS:2, partial [Acaulospora morrowiae]
DEGWKWDYRLNLYHESNSTVNSFKYPIQIILSPNIRNSSLFFLDVELNFTNLSRLIFDVVGPFTILPIPDVPPIQPANNNTNQSGADIFASWNKENGDDENQTTSEKQLELNKQNSRNGNGKDKKSDSW